jgi:glycosyltransferase involved in cell wall biosynthesis
MGLTVAIVTYLRPDKLKRCLASLISQARLPDRVIIVDNDINRSAKPLCERYKKILHIKYLATMTPNTPLARNIALKNCQTELLGFIDDDCVVESNWIQIAKNLKWRGAVAYILGDTKLYNPVNLITKCLHYRQKYWFNFDNLRNKPFTGPFSTDTKNILINIVAVKRKKIWFDERLFLNPIGDHSDTDFGILLKKRGFKGLYNSDLIVYHEESPIYANFLKKAYERGRVAFLISQKHGLHREFVFLPEAKLFRWLVRIKHWPDQINKWVGEIHEDWSSKFGIFLLMKLYDWYYLRGFTDEAKNRDVHLDL